jgi:hypothetical protein
MNIVCIFPLSTLHYNSHIFSIVIVIMAEKEMLFLFFKEKISPTFSFTFQLQ